MQKRTLARPHCFLKSARLILFIHIQSACSENCFPNPDFEFLRSYVLPASAHVQSFSAATPTIVATPSQNSLSQNPKKSFYPIKARRQYWYHCSALLLTSSVVDAVQVLKKDLSSSLSVYCRCSGTCCHETIWVMLGGGSNSWTAAHQTVPA